MVGAGDDVRPAGHRHDDHPAELRRAAADLGFLPDGTSNVWLLVGLVLILAGIMVAPVAPTPPQVAGELQQVTLPRTIPTLWITRAC